MILVTGASGLIGRALCQRFCSEGIPFRAQVRSRARFSEIMNGRWSEHSAEVVEADFSKISEPDLTRLVEGCSTIIHCAGLVHQPNASFVQHEFLNVRAPIQLAEIAQTKQVQKFVFLSTMAVYGEEPFEDADESRVLKPITAYAVSKATCEVRLQSLTGIPSMFILRPALVYGAGDRGNMLSMIRQIKRRRYLHIGFNAARKSLICADDVAEAILLLLAKPLPGLQIFNLANPQPLSVRELAEEIAHCLRSSPSFPVVPESLLRLAVSAGEALLKERAPVTLAQVKKLSTTNTLSVDRLVRAVGFSPRHTLTDSISQEIAWADKHRLL